MERSDIEELHYITPILNIPSILQNGILSHRKVKKMQHHSVAMPEIQERRKKVSIPGGRALHDYVNVYFCARNPMLFKRREQHGELCVLQLDVSLLDLPNLVIADGNASSEYTGFWSYPDGLSKIDKELLFAEYWIDNDPIQKFRKTRVKCAEVLVPDIVDPTYITGAYASCDAAHQSIKKLAPSLSVTIDGGLFFR
jgi:hypothetical protein